MARTAAPRTPAAPTAQGQVARRARILRSAAELGAVHGFDGVQMQEVARDAGVALGTVYRYFPSKTQLFLAVMAAEVFCELPGPGPSAGDAVAEVADLLCGWTRRFTRRPELALAMVRSTLRGYSSPSVEALRMDLQVAPVILERLGVETPTDGDLSRIRILLYSWWGIVIARLCDHMTQDQAEEHIRLGAELLVADASRTGRGGPYVPG